MVEKGPDASPGGGSLYKREHGAFDQFHTRHGLWNCSRQHRFLRSGFFPKVTFSTGDKTPERDYHRVIVWLETRGATADNFVTVPVGPVPASIQMCFLLMRRTRSEDTEAPSRVHRDQGTGERRRLGWDGTRVTLRQGAFGRGEGGPALRRLGWNA